MPEDEGEIIGETPKVSGKVLICQKNVNHSLSVEEKRSKGPNYKTFYSRN